MNCRVVKREVWRRGAGELSESVGRHVADCAECRGLVAEVRALDQVLRGEVTPDPGEAYWESFRSRLAQHLEAGTQRVYRPSPVGIWKWRWARQWVPVVGIAMLAVLLGRELIEDHPPGQVSRPVATMAEKPVALGESNAVPSADNTTDGRSETRSSEGDAVALPDAPGPAATMPERVTVPSLRRSPESRGPESEARKSSTDGGIRETRPEFAESSAEPTPDQQADEEVWPERRIISLGQVSVDTPGRSIDSEKRLADQSAYRAYERQMARNDVSSETAGVYSMPGRLLEAPRIHLPSGFADSQTPAEAMRRYDEIVDLRSLIGDLQSVALENRTLDQRQRLCALWYRLGQITPESVMVDSAIGVLGEYLQTLDAVAGADWFQKRESLIERRQSMGP